LRGTFAPFFRASDSPIAIACFRLFTVPPFPPFPDFNGPFLRRRIALATRFDAERPYFFTPALRRARFFAAIGVSVNGGCGPNAFEKRNSGSTISRTLGAMVAPPAVTPRMTPGGTQD
jgi:hypothetical protein